jgi:hypothetical protein
MTPACTVIGAEGGVHIAHETNSSPAELGAIGGGIGFLLDLGLIAWLLQGVAAAQIAKLM